MARTSRSIDAILIVLGDRQPRRGRLAPAKPPRPAQHVRTWRNRGQSSGRARILRSSFWEPTDQPRSRHRSIPRSSPLAYAIGGVETPRSLLLLELGQSVLGGLLVLGVLRLCRLIAPGSPWMAWTAGLVVALHPTLVYAATHVQVATLGATAADLDAGVGLPDRASRQESRCGDHRVSAPGSHSASASTRSLSAGRCVGGVACGRSRQARARRVGPGHDPRRSLRLDRGRRRSSPLVGISPWLIRNAWSTANSWPSRARLVTRSGRGTVH